MNLDELKEILIFTINLFVLQIYLNLSNIFNYNNLKDTKIF